MNGAQAFDVVVVGGGLAGLTAAVRCAELGLKAAVLEKGETRDYLCNTRVSGGVFHVASQDIRQSSKEQLLAAIARRTFGTADPAVADALAGAAGPTLDWLIAQGGSFIKGGAYTSDAPTAAPPRPLGLTSQWMRTWQGRGPDVLMRHLTARLDKFGGQLVLGAKAEKLILADGRCVGVEATGGRFASRAVVLADGGFQANLDMLKAHIAPVAEGVRQRNAKTGTGDGIRMARDAGAALTPLKEFYGHVLSRDAMRNERLWPYPLLDTLAIAGIVVDKTGRRFGDEGLGGVYVANMIAWSADPLATWVICDANTWRAASQRIHVSSPNPLLEREGGTIFKAPSIAALAQATGLPGDTLAQTIETYNRAHRGGGLAALDPPRTADHHVPEPIEAAPFYAFPACAGITFTMGGIRIDGHARALRPDGTPVGGLYAAGSTTGGLDGGGRACYVSGLTKAAVFGKLAAEHIAGARTAS